MYGSVFSVQYCCIEIVALAWIALAASSSVVPPSYMRNSPSVGVSNTSLVSAQDGVVDAHQVEHALDLADVADAYSRRSRR